MDSTPSDNNITYSRSGTRTRGAVRGRPYSGPARQSSSSSVLSDTPAVSRDAAVSSQSPTVARVSPSSSPVIVPAVTLPAPAVTPLRTVTFGDNSLETVHHLTPPGGSSPVRGTGGSSPVHGVRSAHLPSRGGKSTLAHPSLSALHASRPSLVGVGRGRPATYPRPSWTESAVVPEYSFPHHYESGHSNQRVAELEVNGDYSTMALDDPNYDHYNYT